MTAIASVPSGAAAPLPLQLDLHFAGRAGQTVLARRRVHYPFSLGPLHPWPDGPDGGATAWLQSASGGLYSGDRIGLSLAAAGPGVAACVAATAATVVRACTVPARQEIRLAARDGAVLLWQPRLQILLPGSALVQRISATADAASILILADGFGTHRPAGAPAADPPFGLYHSDIRLAHPGRGTLLHETARVRGADFEAAPPGVTGRYRAFGTLHVLSPRLARSGRVRRAILDGLHQPGVIYGGIARLPPAEGFVVRIAASGPDTLEQESGRILGLLTTAIRHPEEEEETC